MPANFPTAAEHYRDFRERVFRADVVQENSASPNAVSEMEIQARWFGGEFGRKFTSTDDELVEVVQFGHWNHGAGPDFTEAAVRIDDEVKCGTIEIDLEPESWEAHGHGSNSNFNDTVLHIFLKREDRGSRFFTRTENHRAVPQIELDLSQLPDASPVPLHVPEAKTGRCATPLREMPDENVTSLLEAAAQFRLQQKAIRLQKIASAHSRDQAAFQAMAEALGFRHNKVAMAILAQRLPLSKIRNRPAIEREALLFGAAGFIGHEQFDAAEDPAARSYLKNLWDSWWKWRAEFEPESDRAVEWKLSGTRPVNHPQRRLGALAALLNSWPSFAKSALNFASDDWETAARHRLADLDHDFWKTHFTLKSKPSAKPMTMIGQDRIRDILGNILFPLAVSEKPKANWRRYQKLPAVDSNESLRRAILRLFGHDTERGKSFAKRYFQQQALLQIFRDFCLEDASECEDCPFPEQLSQWS